MYLFIASDDTLIKVWNPESWTLFRSLSDHENSVNALVECKGRLVSCDDDGTIKLWNTTSWICELTIHPESEAGGILCLAVLGNYLVSGTDNSAILVWSTQEWVCSRVLHEHQDTVWALCVIGDYLVSGSVDHNIKVWDSLTWTCIRTLTDHEGPIYALVSIEDKLISAGEGCIKLWNSDWTCHRTIESECVWALATYNEQILSGGADARIRVWV